MILYGSNGNPVDADEHGNLKTRSIIRHEINDACSQEKAYSWVSAYTTSGADEEVIYIQNTSNTDDLELHQIIAGSAVNSVFTLYQVTGTAAGTSITGSNLNLASSKTATANAFGNASVTGLTLGNALAKVRVLSNYSDMKDLQGSIIVKPNTAIAVSNSGTGACDVTIIGHYNSLERK